MCDVYMFCWLWVLLLLLFNKKNDSIFYSCCVIILSIGNVDMGKLEVCLQLVFVCRVLI